MNELILVVDDEPKIVKLARTIWKKAVTGGQSQ